MIPSTISSKTDEIGCNGLYFQEKGEQFTKSGNKLYYKGVDIETLEELDLQ